VTSVFESQRADPAHPVALTPQAASEGGPDSKGAGLGVDFFLSLGASLGNLADSIKADRDDRAKMLPPSNEPIQATGVIPATGALILDLGSVPLGHVWQIRRLVVGGTTVTQTATGQAYAFAQGTAPADLNLTNCVDIFSTLPQGNTYGTHQFFLLPSEHLWIAFVNGAVGQQYAAAARVEDYEQTAYNRSVE
jgi:hypothetical protein